MTPKGKSIKVELEPLSGVVNGIIIPDDSKSSMRIGKVVDGNGLFKNGVRVWHMNPKGSEIIHSANVVYWL